MNNHDNTEGARQTNSADSAAPEQAGLPATEQDRRETMRKIGRYSAYIAPVMLAMFSSDAHAS